MNSKSLKSLRQRLSQLGDVTIAEQSQRFFKSGPGEYGEGDVMIGIRVPVLRKIAKQNLDLCLTDVVTLLESSIHEERLLALLVWVYQYDKADDAQCKRIYDAYCLNRKHVNNWDLVDCSAHLIIGNQLLNRNRRFLYKLAKSKSLWDRRIAIISTFRFIKLDDFEDTLGISEILIDDSEDLIHKAVGWMLREVGNRDRNTEESFLKSHYHEMPRTMLRYAIEKFPETLRKRYLNGKV